MARLGGEAGTGTVLDGQTLRIAGLATLCFVAAVTAASLGTSHGLSIPDQPGANAAPVVADLDAVAALVAFAVAHPAYPVLALCGFVLAVAGDETPLLG
ncbi:MAG: hypothetical protein ABEJ26_00885 [Halosimplex sp.]